MIIESFLSYKLNLLTLENFLKIKNLLYPMLNFSLSSINQNEILKFIRYDKKQIRNSMHFVLLKDIGETIIKTNIKDSTLEDAINEVIK